MTWSITVRIRPTSKHAEFLVPVGTHSSVSRLLSHTAIGLPLGNPLTLKSLTFRTSFSIFHCLPALSISRAGEAIIKTIPRDRRKLIKLMLRKSTFLPPRSHLIGQFIKRTPSWQCGENSTFSGAVVETIFCGDHGVRSVIENLPCQFRVSYLICSFSWCCLLWRCRLMTAALLPPSTPGGALQESHTQSQAHLQRVSIRNG